MKVRTYPEMNEKIVGILRLGGQSEQYAAQYLEELRTENAVLRERLEKSVELPIKAGETIYLVINRRSIVCATLENIILSSHCYSIDAVFWSGNRYRRRHLGGSSDFEKKWFISREAAIAHLEQL